MKISARVHNSHAQHQVTLTTDAKARSIVISPKAEGNGSSTNGGELLLLALATCYCNDIYREAANRGIKVTHVEVEAEGEFLAEGAPATMVNYRAKVAAHASEAAIARTGHIHTSCGVDHDVSGSIGEVELSGCVVSCDPHLTPERVIFDCRVIVNIAAIRSPCHEHVATTVHRNGAGAIGV